MSVATATGVKEFFDLTYSNEAASYYILLIELDGSALRACWYHRNKNLVTGFASYELPGGDLSSGIAALLQAHPFLKSEFHQCVVSVRTPNYALLPKSSEDQDTLTLFKVTNEFDDNTQVLLQHDLVGTRASICYALSADTERVMKSSFLNVLMIPHIAPRIEHESSAFKTRLNKNLMVAHLSDERLDIQVYLDGKLQLANSFFKSCKEDVAYYVLYAAEILGIDSEKTPLILSGKISIGDDTWKVLSEYWKHLQLAKAMDSVSVSQQLGDYPQGEFNHLTQALLCAS